MKSSSSASAHWRSSKRRVIGPDSASASRNRRQAAKSSSRWVSADSSGSSSASSRGSIHSRSAASGTSRPSVSSSARRTISAGSASEMPVLRRSISASGAKGTRSPQPGGPTGVPARAGDVRRHLLQLPGEAALADPGNPDHRHDAHAPLRGHGRQQVPQRTQLGIPADKRTPVAGARLAAEPRRDVQRRATRRSGWSALQRAFAGRLESDRLADHVARHIVDEDGAWFGRLLQPRGGVHQVAGDHALAPRVEGDCSLPGGNGGACLQVPAAGRREMAATW